MARVKALRCFPGRGSASIEELSTTSPASLPKSGSTEWKAEITSSTA